MAVIKAKAEKVVPFMLGLMERDAVMPNLVTRLSGDLFKGALGDTITMRTSETGPAAVARDYEFRTRTQPIQFDDIGGGDTSGIPVKIDTHSYSATTLTDEQMTLDEIDFTNEVLAPQVTAVAARMDAKIEAKIAAAHWKDTLHFTPADDPIAVVAEAKRLLDSYKVAPLGGRVFVVGSNVGAFWAGSDRLTRYDSTGETGTPALRDATIGRLAGIQVVVSYAVDPDFACYQHPSAFVFANLAPVVPQGVTVGRAQVRNGYALRWIADYDAMYLRDRSIVSSYLGVSEVLDERDADGVVLPDAARTFNVRGVGLKFDRGTENILGQSRTRRGANPATGVGGNPA